MSRNIRVLDRIRPFAQHPDNELLSAYLDHEVGVAEARTIEAHLNSCEACRSTVQQFRRVVHGLGRVDRPLPPPWLAARVRQQVALAAERGSLWDRLGKALKVVPLQSQAGGVAGVVFAVGLICVLVTTGTPSFQGAHPNEHRGLPSGLASYPGPVEEPAADPNFVLMQTTSEVAGRTFVRQEDDAVWNFLLYEATSAATGGANLAQRKDVWVEEGLQDHQPEARIDVASPRGKALLARYQDLGYLLADGSRVVMRYRQETLELRRGA
ncbi:MAG TPA: zf-HC2 domain-containing protein [Thermoanaerobaculia bacterium]|nr:zf-HC2 domain-containing protein [Thermoanaerobaculia bacterium]